MESDLTSQILEHFNLLESILFLTLWKCFYEIRTLYQGHIKEKEYTSRELKKEIQQCIFTLTEIKALYRSGASLDHNAPPKGRNHKKE